MTVRPDRAADHELVIVAASGDTAAFVDALARLPRVHLVERDRAGRVHIHVADAQAVLEDVTGIATATDVRIASLLVSPTAHETGGLEAQLLTEILGERGEGELG